VYKAEFEGEGTRFVPVCSEEQLQGETGEEVAGKEEGESGDAAKAPPTRKRVLKYTEGLVHRLAMVEELEDAKQ
jgi:hypothetical protein